ncbi:hypothetical protein BOTBODRAFT_39608 [Botryobasidium botryosum FD-172 SS1]|uniref:Uncharacterized protein n=1 Tax=Botryobasidium botryosum (strain FD-172 SS1) TaxID=930990 RepID=A0A067LTL7_BOTB1|nr:hypothetical protein BOTBODRAFT_39608 [Botryobasidium botryosum FD-172 SS1]
MVVKNPLTRGKWTAKKFQATVIPNITVELILFTGIAAAVTCVTKLKIHNLGIGSTMLTVMGTVLGLVVSFRTTSAYDRYWEGRKLWSSIHISSRNLGQIIWIHVPNERTEKQRTIGPHPDGYDDTHLRSIIEKKSMVNLLQALGPAVKHYLRGEGGVYYEDLYPLISFLPRYATVSAEFQSHADTLPLWHQDANALALTRTQTAPSGGATNLDRVNRALHSGGGDIEKGNATSMSLSDSESSMQGQGQGVMGKGFVDARSLEGEGMHRGHNPDPRLMPSRNPPKTSVYDFLPILIVFKPFVSLVKKTIRRRRAEFGVAPDAARSWSGKRKKPEIVQSNVPLEICLFLSSYLAALIRKGLLAPATATGFLNNLSVLQDCVASLERVRTTPIPFAYQAHLRMATWLYLIFLPFQLESTLSWITIPATTFAAFLFLGFLEIGQEIENPFDYDENDLDLDSFCAAIASELTQITAHPAPDPQDFIFSMWNQPFGPADMRTAKEILEDRSSAYHAGEDGVHSVRRTLLQSWRKYSELHGDARASV